MAWVGHYDNKAPIYKKFRAGGECIRTNVIINNGLVHLY